MHAEAVRVCLCRRRLLSWPANHSTMHAFDDDAQAVLSVFKSDRQLQSKQAAMGALQASLQAPNLLSLDGISYAAWVCHLAALLLPYTSTHEMRACKGMAARRYAI